MGRWLQELDPELVTRMYEDSEGAWNYEANLTDYNYELMNNLSVSSARYYKVSVSVGGRETGEQWAVIG